MTKKIFLIFLTLFICPDELKSNYSQKNVQLDISYSTEFYDYMKVLVEPDKSILFWSKNHSHIFFEIHVRFDGWIVFGLSHNGSLAGSDVIIAWLNKNGTGYFSNGHVVDERKLVYDNNFDWKLIYSMRNHEITIFKLVRRIKLCNQNDNKLAFNKNGNFMIFAWGNLDQEVYFNNSNEKLFFDSFVSENFECPSNDLRIKKEIFGSKPAEYYENYAELEKNVYHLYWNISNDFLIVEIHVKTTGWVGFGISPDGKMRDSDVFIGWIKDGKVYYSDRYVYGRRSINDINNDVELLNAFESKGYTVFKIKRPLVLCDPDDRSIETGTPFVIFPWHNDDPINSFEIDLNNDSQSTQLNFFKKNQNVFSGVNEHVYTINLYKKIIPVNYFQYCQAFQISKNLKKKHIYKWSIELPLIDPHQIAAIKLYECSHDYLFASEVNCDLSLNTAFCSQSSIGWSPGAELVVSLPVDTGYPIGTETDYGFFILNVEFVDMEHSSKFIDNLSIHLYLTDKLRKNELGSVTLGTESGPLGILIPPGLDRFPVNTYCFNSCFENKFDYVTFVMARPQTRSVGIQIFTKIIRNKTDFGYLHKSLNHNSKLQYFYELNPRIVVTKNDSLITQCVYSTKKLTKIIQGGLGLNKEVCLYSYFYYPRLNNFKTCKSIPTFNDQLRVFKRLRDQNALNFTSFLNNSKLATLYEAYESLSKVEEFSENLIQSFFSIYLSSNFFAICDGSFNYESHERLLVTSFSQEMDQCNWKINKQKNLLSRLTSKSTIAKQNFVFFLFFQSAIIVLIKILL